MEAVSVRRDGTKGSNPEVKDKNVETKSSSIANTSSESPKELPLSANSLQHPVELISYKKNEHGRS